jgi:tRNA A-37 threonylcarbamoyl transferase component Bud32
LASQARATEDEAWEVLLPSLLAKAGMAAVSAVEVRPLAGGVSSDIVRVRLSDGSAIVAKRALRQLRVADEWRVPLERNHYEIGWFKRANAIVPGSAPAVLGEDRERGIALLSYLPPDQYSLWKTDLLAGRTDPHVARRVADTIGRIHRATLRDPEVAAAFPTDDLFDALRLDPYLRTTATRHPEIAGRMLACLDATRSAKVALVHGDLSPKNIFVSRADGHPVILDAECAWYGDPVFDLAFCMNHLLLKAIHMPQLAEPLLSEARDFFGVWLGHFPADMHGELGNRAATLLPCLMLARVDGKSPVEYLTRQSLQLVRGIAIPLIREPRSKIAEVVDEVANRRGTYRA